MKGVMQNKEAEIDTIDAIVNQVDENDYQSQYEQVEL